MSLTNEDKFMPETNEDKSMIETNEADDNKLPLNCGELPKVIHNMNFNHSLQWPINVLTNEPDTIRTCERVWIACLTPILTVPVYDMKDSPASGIESDDDSTIATLDDDWIAPCDSYLKYRARLLIQKMLDMSDTEWEANYVPIVYEIAQLQASVDPELALDMARNGLAAINSSLRLRYVF